MVLISSLLLLLVVTILAVAIFRNFGMEEKIAGNQREKERALHAAESAQQYAEWWLSSGQGTAPILCSILVPATQGQVCSNTLPSIVPNGNVANIPWQINGANVGVTYAPPNMILTQAGGVNTYFQTPVFYISYLGLTADSKGTNYKLLYQVDAASYGGSANAVAVVESTYYVTSGVCNLGQIGGC
jgi:type IV pilus assembly protein PilX